MRIDGRARGRLSWHVQRVQPHRPAAAPLRLDGLMEASNQMDWPSRGARHRSQFTG